MDFDSTRLYYSHQQLQRNNNNDDDGDGDIDRNSANNNVMMEDKVHLPAVRRHFREFLRTFFCVVLRRVVFPEDILVRSLISWLWRRNNSCTVSGW
jgi:hypothetical protein